MKTTTPIKKNITAVTCRGRREAFELHILQADGEFKMESHQRERNRILVHGVL